MAPGVLLERDGEVSELAGAVRAAAAGNGQVISIVGSAGLGKTSLLGVAEKLAKETGFIIARAVGSELERDLGWGLAADLLDQLLERVGADERTGVLSGRAAPAELVLVGDGEHDGASLPAGKVAAITVALTLAVQRLASEHPLALLVDDAHWADVPSLRWLCHLAVRIHECELLVIVGFRGEELDAPRDLLGELESAPAVLHLVPLSPVATAALVTPGDANAPASSAVHLATGGNPFLIDQLLRHLGGPPRSAAEVEQARPERLARVTEARLARLGEDAEELARAVAVLGVASSISRAARVAGLSSPAAATAAERLSAAGIFADRLPLEFEHPLLLKIVRESIRAARIDSLRRRAAQVLADDGADLTQAAVHLLSAEPVGEPWAGELLARAGQRAFDRAAHESAAAFLQRALGEPMSDARRNEVMLDLGRALLMSGSDGGLDALRDALTGMQDPDRRAHVALEVGDAFVTADRLTEGISFYDRVLAEATAGTELRAAVLARRALTFLGSRFDPTLVLTTVTDALQAIEQVPATGDRAALSLKAIVLLWTGTPAPACAPELEKALAGRPVGDRSALEWSLDLAWLAAGLAWCDCYERRDAFLDELIQRARKRGASLDLALGAAWRSYGRMRKGEIAEAWEDIQLARAVLNELDDQHHMVVSAFSLDPLIERAQLNEAERLLAELPPPAGDDDIAYYGLIDARSRLHIARHRLQEARRDLELLRDEMASRLFKCPGALCWRPQLVTVLQLLGEQSAARALADEGLEDAKKFDAPRALAQALVAAAATRPPEEAADLLEEAVWVLDPPEPARKRPEARLDLARAEVACGALSRRRGLRSDALTHLRRGLSLASACGASALASQAIAELHIAGARPRRSRYDGPEALTAAERRVAELAVAGAGNREIAERLVVTRRTVETHLTSTYRKLGITGREALAEHLSTLDEADEDTASLR